MAITTRAPRVLVTDDILKVTNPIVGPGSYIENSKINEKKPHLNQRNYAPFNSTAMRSPDLIRVEKNITPGPGDYLGTIKPKEKVIKINNQEVRIAEELKPSGVFRSKSNRFQNQDLQAINPGPGTYNYVDDRFGSIIRKRLKHKSKDDMDSMPKLIVQEILSTRISIPSIPSLHQSYGYFENDNGELLLNEHPDYSLNAKRNVGPGDYNIESDARWRNKGTTWCKSKSRRVPIEANHVTNEKIGPGSYKSVLEINNVPKVRQSAIFSSKVPRGFDERKGSVAKEFNIETLKKQLNQMGIGVDNKEIEEQLKGEYIENATPGPGYYSSQDHSRSTLVKKSSSFQNFGSGIERFQSNDQDKDIYTAPGMYYKQGDLVKKSASLAEAPFLSYNLRFMKKKELKVPGPGAYETNATLENKLVDKIKYGTKIENFGSHIDRFPNEDPLTIQPGPGTYIKVKLEPEIQEPAQRKFQPYKAKSNKNPNDVSRVDSILTKPQGPPVGTYHLNYYDISKKQEKITEALTDNIFNPPPFNTSEIRSVGKSADEEESTRIDSSILKSLLNENKDINDFIKNKAPKQHKAPFLVKADRFNYKNNEDKGTEFLIDHNDKTWNKPSYNVLYSNIS